MVFLIPVISTPIFLPNYALAKRRETYHGNVLTDGGHGDSGGVALGVDIDDGLLLGVLNGAVINVDVDGLGMAPRGSAYGLAGELGNDLSLALLDTDQEGHGGRGDVEHRSGENGHKDVVPDEGVPTASDRRGGEGGIQGGDGGVDGLGKRGKALGDEDDTPRNRTLRRSILLAHQGGEDEHQGLDVELLDERGEFDLRVGRTRSPIHR